VYRKEPSTPDSVLNDCEIGSIAGEGANFLLICRDENQKGLRIRNVSAFVTREAETALDKVNQFLNSNQIKPEDIDLVMLGVNGDSRTAAFYQRLRDVLFRNNAQGAFKHICGEYPVASSFAVGLLASSLSSGLPEATILNKAPDKLNRILLVNNFIHHYSCWLLEAD
jgi:hypothetical protein